MKEWLTREQLEKMGDDAEAFEKRTDPYGFRVAGKGNIRKNTMEDEHVREISGAIRSLGNSVIFAGMMIYLGLLVSTCMHH